MKEVIINSGYLSEYGKTKLEQFSKWLT